MKKNLLLLLILSLSFIVRAQNSIPNGNFENWTNGSFDLPNGFPVSSNQQAYFRTNTPFNVIKSTDSYHGTYAVQLSTNISATSDTAFAYFIPVQPSGSPFSWHGGMAYDQKPLGIRGYFKYNLATADSGTILVAFSKSGINIGTYVYTLGGMHSDYTLFDFTFTPALADTPDSVIFAALSCKFSAETQQPVATGEGSLFLDSVSFTSVASQPAAFDGDFENWINYIVSTPDDWHYNGSDQGDGLYKSTDAMEGSYALELKTFEDIGDQGPRSNGAQISNSVWDNNCNCNVGGTAFSHQNDTLEFWYKYSPSDNDSAYINIGLQKAGANIWGSSFYLHAAPEYTLMEIPINAFQQPDTILINISSSSNNSNSLSLVGSDLLIDSIFFKSQVINTSISKKLFSNRVNIYPNPSNGMIQIQDLGFNIQKLEIYNVQGRNVYSYTYENSKSLSTINLTSLPSGIYFVKVFGENKVHTQKIVIQ